MISSFLGIIYSQWKVKLVSFKQYRLQDVATHAIAASSCKVTLVTDIICQALRSSLFGILQMRIQGCNKGLVPVPVLSTFSYYVLRQKCLESWNWKGTISILNANYSAKKLLDLQAKDCLKPPTKIRRIYKSSSSIDDGKVVIRFRKTTPKKKNMAGVSETSLLPPVFRHAKQVKTESHE